MFIIITYNFPFHSIITSIPNELKKQMIQLLKKYLRNIDTKHRKKVEKRGQQQGFNNSDFIQDASNSSGFAQFDAAWG